MLFSTLVDYICGLVMTKDARGLMAALNAWNRAAPATVAKNGLDDQHHYQPEFARLFQIFQFRHG